MRIGRLELGPGLPCFIAAEVAQAHEGSVRVAHDYIDAIATTGASAVKFQCHLADHETNTEWRIKPKWGNESRLDYWRRMEFTLGQWCELADHCKSVGLEFLVSPFSVEAVRLLDSLVPAWKVPSGKIADMRLLGAVRASGKPVILSAGMANMEEVLAAKWAISHLPHITCECTSAYPCAPEQMDLEGVRRRHALSDHSGTIYPGIAAAAMGCQYLEVHVKLSEWDSGPDASSSLLIEDLSELVQGVRFVEQGMRPARKMVDRMRELFMGGVMDSQADGEA